MADPRFFTRSQPLPLKDLAALAGITLDESADGSRLIHDVTSLDRAGPEEISFLDNVKYIETFASSKAGACFARAKFAGRAPASMTVLVTDEPYRSFALVAHYFYPPYSPDYNVSPQAIVHPTARLGSKVCIEAGAVIGAHVELGEKCHIASGAVIQQGVVIGDESHVGANSTLSHCIIGRRVIIHRGVHIGQDGFGFALGREGHLKVPQLGRVLIDDDVEIGSGTCIDRGTGPDTHIGAGTKIDNLVQIGHNVQIGRMSVLVAQVGIAGSTRVGDGVMLGGQVGLAGHIKIGSGARIVAQSGVMADVPAGETYGGSPAVPVKDWHRQTIALGRLASKKGADT